MEIYFIIKIINATTDRINSNFIYLVTKQNFNG